MSDTVTLRAIVTVEYAADPSDYGTDDPVRMAAIDASNWQDDPMAFFSSFDDDQYRVEVNLA